jgi:hypothetical protein
MTNLPLLKQVVVYSCDLTTSHAGTSCDWEELCITECLTVAALTRLPLRGIRKLEVSHMTSRNSIRSTPSWSAAITVADLAAALASAPDCALACNRMPILEFTCDSGELQVLLQRWECNGVKGVSLTSVHGGSLSPAAVGALVSLLGRTPSCTELRINGFSPPDPPILPELHNSTVGVVVLEEECMTEARLMAWCAGHVSRPMCVWWEGKRLLGELFRVRQALREHGDIVHLESGNAVDDDYAYDHGMYGMCIDDDHSDAW